LIKDLDINIIIVNYKTTHYLVKCLDSIISNIKGYSYKIIVVDNNSEDEILKGLKLVYANVKFYELNINNGFGYGNNYGFKNEQKAKYTCFLNPDITLKDNIFAGLIEYMENDKQTALCSGILLNEKGDPDYSYNSFPDFTSFLRDALISGNQGKIKKLNNSLIRKNESKKAVEVDWVMGACMLMRSEVFTEVNGFDEKFFLYFEDTDLQLRIRKLGYRIMCLPYVKMIHNMKSSIKKDVIENTYHLNMNKSRVYYINKHFGFFRRNIFKKMFALGIIIRICILPFNKKYGGCRNMKYLQLKTNLLLYF